MTITSIKDTLPTPYVSLAEAETLLESESPWINFDDEVKQEALGWARSYLDANYTHSFSDDDPPVNIKYANAYLANKHLTKSLFSRQTSTDPLEEVEVVAGPVKTRKRYAARTNWFDPFPEITQLISDVSSLRPRRIDNPVVRA